MAQLLRDMSTLKGKVTTQKARIDHLAVEAGKVAALETKLEEQAVELAAERRRREELEARLKALEERVR